MQGRFFLNISRQRKSWSMLALRCIWFLHKRILKSWKTNFSRDSSLMAPKTIWNKTFSLILIRCNFIAKTKCFSPKCVTPSFYYKNGTDLSIELCKTYIQQKIAQTLFQYSCNLTLWEFYWNMTTHSKCEP